MKTYDTKIPWQDYLKELQTEIDSVIRPPTLAVHKLKGSCIIKGITVNDKNIFVILQFAEAAATYSLLWLVEHAQLTWSDGPSEVLTEISDAFKVSIFEREKQVKEEERLQRERQQQLKEEAKKAEAEKRKREELIAKTKKLKPQAIISEPHTYYETIGWLARHVSTVSAQVPTELDAWFIQNFGVVPHTVVDTSKKTISGHAMKFSISFKASFKQELPTILASLPGAKTKSIDSVAYIWDLVQNCGFKFGKVQDLEAIRSCVPDEYRSEFETGLGPEPETKTPKSRKKAIA